MKLEVLVSTMNKEDLSLVNEMNIKSDVLIINQSPVVVKDLEVKKKFNARMLSFNEKGLSKSRNQALQNAQGDICLIADDDVRYHDDYVDKVINAHKEYVDYDIIVFAVPTTNTDREKKYYRSKKRMGYVRSLKIASFEISFKRTSIIDNNIKFNEEFGAGSGQYSMGEENIFIYQCLKKGLKILYLPIEIGLVTHEESTWFFGYNEKYFMDKGACYAAMSPKFAHLIALQFAVRKYFIYKKSVTLRKACGKMFTGIKGYLRKS